MVQLRVLHSGGVRVVQIFDPHPGQSTQSEQHASSLHSTDLGDLLTGCVLPKYTFSARARVFVPCAVETQVVLVIGRGSLLCTM